MTDPAPRLRAASARRAAILALGLAALGFVLLALALLSGATDGFDRAAVLWLREAGQPGGPGTPLAAGTPMAIATMLGGKPLLATAGLLTAALLAVLRRWREAAFLALALLGGLEISGLMKEVFGRLRPDMVVHMVQEASASFPSGHATYSAIAYLASCILMIPRLGSPAGRAGIVAAATALVLLVGFSRVYLGVHYPSDVLAGWCLGAAWTLACWLVTRPIPGGAAGTAKASAGGETHRDADGDADGGINRHRPPRS